jgi:hypothetical protein
VLTPHSEIRQDSATVTPSEEGTYRIRYRAASPSLLKLSVPWYPGWHAYTAGREMPVLRVDHALILNPAVRRPSRPVRHLPPMISNCGADHLLGDKRFFCNRLQPTVRWPLRGPQLPDLG